MSTVAFGALSNPAGVVRQPHEHVDAAAGRQLLR